MRGINHPLLLLLILASWKIQKTHSDCPDQCVCMWKSGKETTECVNRDKKSIPPGIAPSTQVLDLRGNNIRVLHNNVFLQLGITNLQRIFCPYCGIVEIEPRAFYRLTNLVELDLSENAMREVPSEAWKHTKALMRLNLSGNPIKLIRSGAFSHLLFVTSLALSHCDIETLEDGAFDGMDSLTEIKLESNKLQYVQGSGLFPRHLNHIEIHANPFRCDCRLLDFTHWLQRSGVPKTVEPACKTPPRLENRTLSALKLDELACLPQVEPAALVTDAVAGANVSLRCSVFGLPSASVSWWHSNRLVANGSELQHAWEDQYYSIAEYRTNDHQLVSELIVLAIRPEDDGTFFCAAQNPAGVARANFTVRVVDSLENSGAGGTSGGLQESTDSYNSKDTIQEDMFKVEYILGFGAAAVIVLTIIIVLILYLILQFRSQRRKRRAARAAGLHCDSNSGSYMERSTVDFIVPGEMELTSAVRSVSSSNKCNGLTVTKALVPPAPKEKDGCGSGNDGDDEEDYGNGINKKTNGYKAWPVSTTSGFLPPYRHPPPYNNLGGCPRGPPNNPIMCQCCGQFQQQQWFQPQFQPPQPQFGQQRMCPRSAQLGIPFRPQAFQQPQRPLAHSMLMQPNYPTHFAASITRQPFMVTPQHQQDFSAHWLPGHAMHHGEASGASGGHFPNKQHHHAGGGQHHQNWMMLQDATSESSTACDNEEIKYGPFSDGEADKCHYRSASGGHHHHHRSHTRSRSLPRRPASSMMNYNPSPNVPHYVTLSRAAMVEAGDARMFEHHSLQLRPSLNHQRGGVRYSSQPQLNRNAILDYAPVVTTTSVPPPPPPSVPVMHGPYPGNPSEAKSKTKMKASSKVPPKYQQPVSQQVSLENSEYLFPDLPPPPDALLDNTTTSASPSSFQQNSRCSSLDDLNWVTSAAEMSRSLQVVQQVPQGFHRGRHMHSHKSNTLPTPQPPKPSTAASSQPISIMKKRASNPIELRRSSGAVKVDLSSADKSIRRPGSEPDLKTSPMRSSMRTPTQNEVKRLSGISQGSTTSKKVMFSGVAASDGENDSNNGDHDDVWVLRCEDMKQIDLVPNPAAAAAAVNNLADLDDVPVTGVVIAQPQPCKFVMAQIQQQQRLMAHSPKKMVKATPPPPPPRTTPCISTQGAVALSQPPNGAVAVPPVSVPQPVVPPPNGRPQNPNLQRPVAQHGQFHESPDEGYHEDDAGSEVL